MANQLYSYSSTYGAAETSTPSLYTEAQLKYSDILRYSSATTAPHLSSQQTWPPGVDPTDLLTAGIKRSSEALYHQTPLGTNATIQQSEAWYSTYYLGKRPRLESTSNLPVYPQRPGEKDCAHYMQTRTCKFGDTCKFDHPIWVPEGGIPDWKEVPLITTSESLPERPGEPDCPYFLKTQRCKFGSKCKFNHPKDKLISSGVLGSNDASALPERPSEPTCAFYLKTGNCKFGTTCKFHHPKDIYIPTDGQENGDSKQDDAMIKTQESGDANSLKPLVVHAPAIAHNAKGLPIRLGEVDCPFYMKTGSCKYGATCRYNHPDRNAVSYPAIVHPSITSPTPSLNFGVLNPAASLYHTIDSRLAQPMVGVGLTVYPQRPGHIECDFYMKTGECKFGERCKFHHPIDRTVPTLSAAKQATQENVKLTLAGLPRREGAVHCPYYMKTGTCKYGSTCKFDHPPPGEVIAKSAASDGGDEKEAYTARTQDEQE